MLGNTSDSFIIWGPDSPEKKRTFSPAWLETAQHSLPFLACVGPCESATEIFAVKEIADSEVCGQNSLFLTWYVPIMYLDFEYITTDFEFALLPGWSSTYINSFVKFSIAV